MVGAAMTTYPLPAQPDLLTSAALDARSRRALACARAVRAVARGHGHHEHAVAVDRDLAAGNADALREEERAWHDASLRAFGLLLGALGIGPGAGEADEDEACYQAVLDEVFGLGGDDVH